MAARHGIAVLVVALACGCGGDGGSDDAVGPGTDADPADASGGVDAPGGLGVAPVPYTGWRPAVTSTWQWQLDGAVNTTYDAEVYDIDLFEVPAAAIDALHAAGRRVLCYFSAGSHENWRPDAAAFPEAVIGRPLDDWEGERWLDIRADDVRRLTAARLDLAGDRGCDGVEPDNVDGYTQDSGFPLTTADQLAFNAWLANAAHERGLFVALKNDLDQVDDLEPFFDLSVDEQCHEFDECGALAPFPEAGKPVFNAEYARRFVDDPVPLCSRARAENIRTLVLPLGLDDTFRIACD